MADFDTSPINYTFTVKEWKNFPEYPSRVDGVHANEWQSAIRNTAFRLHKFFSEFEVWERETTPKLEAVYSDVAAIKANDAKQSSDISKFTTRVESVENQSAASSKNAVDALFKASEAMRVANEAKTQSSGIDSALTNLRDRDTSLNQYINEVSTAATGAEFYAKNAYDLADTLDKRVKGEIATLTKKVNETYTFATDLSRYVQTARSEVSALTARVDTVTSDMSTLRTDMSEAESRVSAAASTVESMGDRVTSVEQNVATLSNSVTSSSWIGEYKYSQAGTILVSLGNGSWTSITSVPSVPGQVLVTDPSAPGGVRFAPPAGGIVKSTAGPKYDVPVSVKSEAGARYDNKLPVTLYVGGTYVVQKSVAGDTVEIVDGRYVTASVKNFILDTSRQVFAPVSLVVPEGIRPASDQMIGIAEWVIYDFRTGTETVQASAPITVHPDGTITSPEVPASSMPSLYGVDTQSATLRITMNGWRLI